jgi:thiol-disulfide isomerase/thioredoxin
MSEFDINSTIPVDTVKTDQDGNFRFTFRHKGPGFYLVKIDNKNYVTLIIENEKEVELSSDLPNIRNNYVVKGSPDSELYRDFEMFLEVNRNKVDSLTRTYSDYQRSPGFRNVKTSLDNTYQEIFENQRNYSIQFVKNHCNSLAALLVLNRRFGERKILAEDLDYEYFITVDSCLSINYKDFKHLVEFEKRLDAVKNNRKIYEMTEKRLTIGNKIPDIELENPSGKKINLYSLQGKPVILYFWASWDKDSRRYNLILKDLVNKAGKDKPQVFAIGFESYKDVWTDAIKSDQIQDWTHVTDYLGASSSAKTMFNVPDKFPYFLFLDKNLIIKYKGNNLNELGSQINKESK